MNYKRFTSLHDYAEGKAQALCNANSHFFKECTRLVETTKLSDLKASFLESENKRLYPRFLSIVLDQFLDKKGKIDVVGVPYFYTPGLEIHGQHISMISGEPVPLMKAYRHPGVFQKEHSVLTPGETEIVISYLQKRGHLPKDLSTIDVSAERLFED